MNFRFVNQLGKEADSFLLRLYAALSEKERELISARIKAALKVLNDQGAQLGNRTNLETDQLKGQATNGVKATEFTDKVLSMIVDFRNESETLSAIAEQHAINRTGDLLGR
jgi:DNA invertase Pin-like site-specific DNA recombinase